VCRCTISVMEDVHLCRTYTTDYCGTVSSSSRSSGNGEPGSSSAQVTAAEAASPVAEGPEQAPAWERTDSQIPRALLTARDPILYFDELPLYESELDDHGAARIAVKARTARGT
jgi:hypothetical protein